MSDQPVQTPLIDQLRSVPHDARATYDHGQFSSSSFPYGRMCAEAADEIERLRGEVDRYCQATNSAYAFQMKQREKLESAVIALAAERQRARLPEELVARLRSIVDFHGPKSTTSVLVDILAWHDSTVEQGDAR